MADAVPLSGSIDPKAFPFLIGHLHRQGATGSLKVDGPSYQKAIYFRAGRILFGSSNDPKDQLGAILIESGRISPEQLEDVNGKVGPGNPLAKVLAESGFVSQRELSEAARAKVERILSDVMGYTAGSFEFEDGVLPKGAVDLKLSTEKVIVAAVRRIGDRNFVLRHVEGLDAVFVPAADAATALAEIEADTGPVVRGFDGRSSLKEAAAKAPLDEFDTSKIACALLFLGLVERADAAIVTTTADSGPLFSTDELESSLDLGASDASVAAEEAAAPDATLLISEPLPESPGLAIEATPEPAPPLAEPPIPPPSRAPTPPPRSVTPAPREPAPPPAPAPMPEPQEPATILLPPAHEMPATTMIGTTSYTAPSFEADEEEEPPPAPASAPPSKEDLAALDALLNARHVEGPLEPMAKSAEARWEPHFAQVGRGGRSNKRSSRSPILVVGAALVLVIAAAAAWTFLPHGGTTPPAKPPATTATAAPTTTLASEATTTLAAAPATSLAAAPTTTTAPAPTTLRSARATPPPPPPTTAAPAPARSTNAGSLADARAAFVKGDLAAAARGFTANLKAAGREAHTVQILVACSDETVHKAAQAVSAPELFIVPVDYKGRSCYRVCWGIYEGEAKARTAVATVPDYFRKGGAVPKAVPAATVLP